MLIVPSKLAAEISPAVFFDHCASKFQLELAGNSAKTLPSFASQTKVLLSLPLDSNKSPSWGDHAKDKTPFVCPTNSFVGATLFLKSHTCNEHDLSSSLATINCVATSGFQLIAEHLLFDCGSTNEITGLCLFKSHTTVVPLVVPQLAKMCDTFVFH